MSDEDAEEYETPSDDEENTNMRATVVELDTPVLDVRLLVHHATTYTHNSYISISHMIFTSTQVLG